LKYGKSGKPHYRHISVSLNAEGKRMLYWRDLNAKQEKKTKKVSKAEKLKSIQVEDIEELR